MKTRSINQLVEAQRVQMGDVWLYQSLPLPGMDQVDPFLLIHHWFDTLPGGKKPNEVGVGPHPHRGFSPVTFIFKGSVHHRDSLGHSEIVSAGGTQWMHSGSGLVHSERPDKESAEKGGEFEIIQFWVNAPASKKMKKPFYVPLHQSDTPNVALQDKKSTVGVVAGEFQGTKGAIETETPQQLLRFDLKKGADLFIPIPKTFNAVLYVLDGSISLEKGEVRTRTLAWFQNDGEGIAISANEDTRAILLAGAPINEKVVSYGPFVMNSDKEIRQAIHDYQDGNMGTLIENFD